MGSHTPRQRISVKAFLSKRLVIGATGLVVLAGAAGAVAATQGSTGFGSQAYINDLAGRLGVTPSALTAAIKASDSDQIDAALAAGRLTQVQATALKARIQASTGVPVLGPRFGAGGVRGSFGGRAATAPPYVGDLGGPEASWGAAPPPGRNTSGSARRRCTPTCRPVNPSRRSRRRHQASPWPVSRPRSSPPRRRGSTPLCPPAGSQASGSSNASATSPAESTLYSSAPGTAAAPGPG